MVNFFSSKQESFPIHDFLFCNLERGQNINQTTEYNLVLIVVCKPPPMLQVPISVKCLKAHTIHCS